MFGSGVPLVSRTDQLNPGSPGHSPKTPPGTDSFPQIVVAPSGRSSEICAAHAAAGLLGHTDDALDHLRRAIQLMPEIARFAREDQDLVALRDEPGFAELTGD